MSGLPKFYERSICKKCNNDEADTEYVPSERGVMNFSGSWIKTDRETWPEGEFLKRTCGRCGYQWAQAVRS